MLAPGLVVWRSAGAGVLRVLPDLHADLMFWRGGLHLAGYDTVAHDFDRGAADTTYGVRLPPGSLRRCFATAHSTPSTGGSR